MVEPRRPTLVRLVTRLNIGGPARQALLLTRALRDEYETVLGAGTPPAHEGELSDPDVDVTRLPLTRPVRPVPDLRALRRVHRLLAETEPEIVHTHMAKAGALGRIAAAQMSTRPVIVHTFHGHVLDRYFRAPARRTFIAIERALARRSDALIAVSEEIKDELFDLGVGTASIWHVIPVGFDLSPFLAVERGDGAIRRGLGIPPRAFVVATLGRLTKIKDHASLVTAMARVDGAHLVVLGDGEERPALEQQAQRAGIDERTHFMGWTSDVATVLSDVDAVALTSRAEGTPVALIEAAAAARPVVATDVGGVRAVIRDKQHGLLVPPGDVDAIAGALNALSEDEARRTRMGARGREHVRARFDHKRLISDIRELYRDLRHTRSRRT